MHHAFRFELDQNNRTRSALSSHAGAGRFAYNWGLALVKSRLGQREQVRRAGFRELLPDDEVERLVRTVEVPWNLPALRKEWNHAQGRGRAVVGGELTSAPFESAARCLTPRSTPTTASGSRAGAYLASSSQPKETNHRPASSEI
ncbi:MAG: transposase, partial [Acidimicrobiaceae bacterium]|nr:transposase [Acidimicrobiaceae bacterium]